MIITEARKRICGNCLDKKICGAQKLRIISAKSDPPRWQCTDKIITQPVTATEQFDGGITQIDNPPRI